MKIRRQDAEIALAAALSRYVGYTTGATFLDRIARTTERVGEKPFRYEVELIREIRAEYKLTDKTAAGVLDFAVGLGFLERFESGGLHSRIALSSGGRAYRAALACGNSRLRDLLLEFAVLEYDCDLYGLLLDEILFVGEAPVFSFAMAIDNLRTSRLDWLRRVIGAEVLVRRIAEHVRWLVVHPSEIEIVEVGHDFVRHHTTPRRGWARALGHLDETDKLTTSGRELVARIRGERPRFFWLGPEADILASLNVDFLEVPQPLGSAWNILRPRTSPFPPSSDLISELSEFMISQYPAVRLVRTNQAPLDAVRPFLFLKEVEAGKRFDESAVWDGVFSSFASLLAPISGKGRTIAHYQLRGPK